MSTVLNQETIFADILDVCNFLKSEYQYCELVEVVVNEIEDCAKGVFITIELPTSSRTWDRNTYYLSANDLIDGNWDGGNLEQFEENYIWHQF
jgi:hypothetical protein